MANLLKADKRVQILKLLAEGNSIRSTARLADSQIRTVLRHLLIAGEKCRDFLHENLRDLNVKHVQCDEIWTFTQKKEGRLTDAERSNPNLGDQYLFVALDEETKLICTYAIGKRTAETTERFMDDLARRIITPSWGDVLDGAPRPQLSTDGFNPYPKAVANSFGELVSYGILIKNYSNPDSGRYAPPTLANADRRSEWGVQNIRTICTSHVERSNLTIRTFMKRFNRLTLGFSKKLPNLRAAVALHVFHYNFCRIHGSLKMTPAMKAGVTDRLWSLEDLFG